MSYSVQFSKYGADAGARAARSLGVVDSLNLRELERMACQTALEQAGSIVEAAHLLGITRHALKRRIIIHNIRWVRESTVGAAAEPTANAGTGETRC